MLYFLDYVFSILLMMAMVLISVAFLTLLERKVLGYIQIRKGPNKVGYMGILQPFSDAIKLFNKEFFYILKSNYFFYLFSPLVGMILMLMLWNLVPYMSMVMLFDYNFMLILCFLSCGVYPLMIGGWSSNSLYSLLGGLRSVAQTISYEVSLILVMLSLVYIYECMNFFNFIYYQKMFLIYLYNLPIFLVFFVSLLAELNRTPFDFSEGESELVSGFNIEYMSGEFALIFIAEYGMIMFMMMLMVIFFFYGSINMLVILLYMFYLFLVIWVRGTFPRFRYDNLMYLNWMSYLPLSLNYMIFLICLKSMNY
uniref:NADH dehydrogenase subunit 1 n=1 Tax=Lamennaisia ambigua TaxID=3064205 RepID=UPI00286C7F2D|nr:NADH dehydrogenase subunit 1 [Lamennaisia ambigua]WKV28909.1 NADH dehydrogenase subunit 1 [Lamennaisia ambigua]